MRYGCGRETVCRRYGGGEVVVHQFGTTCTGRKLCAAEYKREMNNLVPSMNKDSQ